MKEEKETDAVVDSPFEFCILTALRFKNRNKKCILSMQISGEDFSKFKKYFYHHLNLRGSLTTNLQVKSGALIGSSK